MNSLFAVNLLRDIEYRPDSLRVGLDEEVRSSNRQKLAILGDYFQEHGDEPLGAYLVKTFAAKGRRHGRGRPLRRAYREKLLNGDYSCLYAFTGSELYLFRLLGLDVPGRVQASLYRSDSSHVMKIAAHVIQTRTWHHLNDFRRYMEINSAGAGDFHAPEQKVFTLDQLAEMNRDYLPALVYFSVPVLFRLYVRRRKETKVKTDLT